MERQRKDTKSKKSGTGRERDKGREEKKRRKGKKRGKRSEMKRPSFHPCMHAYDVCADCFVSLPVAQSNTAAGEAEAEAEEEEEEQEDNGGSIQEEDRE